VQGSQAQLATIYPKRYHSMVYMNKSMAEVLILHNTLVDEGKEYII
jgi:hypothetical protein